MCIFQLDDCDRVKMVKLKFYLKHPIFVNNMYIPNARILPFSLIILFVTLAYQNYENDEDTDDLSETRPHTTRIIERDFEKLVLINRTRPTPCDREMYLYQLDYKNLDEKLNRPLKACDRPFYVQLVNYTNMILVVVNGLCPASEVPIIPIQATEVQYNESLPCLKHMHPLYRKQPTSCIRNHTEESNIDMCGRGSLPPTKLWIILGFISAFRYFMI